MSGVEILNQYQVASEVCNETAVAATFFIVFGILAILGIVVACYEHEQVFMVVGIILGIAFGFLFAFPVGAITAQPGDAETHYKVTIDDSVSMNEFLDKYEILGQEGKIYTVKERE